MEYGHPLTNYVCNVMEHVELQISKMNTPLKKEFPLALLKKIVTLVLSSTFESICHPLHIGHNLCFVWIQFSFLGLVLDFGQFGSPKSRLHNL